MKKAIPIILAVLVAQATAVAHAEAPVADSATLSYTVVLAGGSAQNMMRVWLTPDGRSYVIDSVVPLEVGGTICVNPPGNANELICKAPMVAGFEVNAGVGDDSVTVSRAIDIPVTLRGGAGQDTLLGGSGPDKLIGGDGNDDLSGRGGDDLIFGGPGADALDGGTGNDVLRGGDGSDSLGGGAGKNTIRQTLRPLG